MKNQKKKNITTLFLLLLLSGTRKLEALGLAEQPTRCHQRLLPLTSVPLICHLPSTLPLFPRCRYRPGSGRSDGKDPTECVSSPYLSSASLSPRLPLRSSLSLLPLSLPFPLSSSSPTLSGSPKTLITSLLSPPPSQNACCHSLRLRSLRRQAGPHPPEPKGPRRHPQLGRPQGRAHKPPPPSTRLRLRSELQGRPPQQNEVGLLAPLPCVRAEKGLRPCSRRRSRGDVSLCGASASGSEGGGWFVDDILTFEQSAFLQATRSVEPACLLGDRRYEREIFSHRRKRENQPPPRLASHARSVPIARAPSSLTPSRVLLPVLRLSRAMQAPDWRRGGRGESEGGSEQAHDSPPALFRVGDHPLEHPSLRQGLACGALGAV